MITVRWSAADKAPGPHSYTTDLHFWSSALPAGSAPTGTVLNSSLGCAWKCKEKKKGEGIDKMKTFLSEWNAFLSGVGRFFSDGASNAASFEVLLLSP